MKVKDHYLYDHNDVKVPYKASPNHGGPKKSISYLIIHYDASANATGAISWMVSPESKVSAELHIARDGKVTQLVPFNLTAYHAGKSEWKGLVGLNSHSIGIELQNTGTQEYTEIQLAVLDEVAKALDQAYHFKEILGHSDIAPGRKSDPGKQFPMKWLRDQIYGGKVATKTTTSDLNLRAGRGTEFPKVAVLPKGTEVNVLSEENDWSEVLVCSSSMKGFVSSKYLK